MNKLFYKNHIRNDKERIHFDQTGKGNFWVALYDDKVVGTISFLDIGNHQVALRKML